MPFFYVHANLFVIFLCTHSTQFYCIKLFHWSDIIIGNIFNLERQASSPWPRKTFAAFSHVAIKRPKGGAKGCAREVWSGRGHCRIWVCLARPQRDGLSVGREGVSSRKDCITANGKKKKKIVGDEEIKLKLLRLTLLSGQLHTNKLLSVPNWIWNGICHLHLHFRSKQCVYVIIFDCGLPAIETKGEIKS